MALTKHGPIKWRQKKRRPQPNVTEKSLLDAFKGETTTIRTQGGGKDTAREEKTPGWAVAGVANLQEKAQKRGGYVKGRKRKRGFKEGGDQKR